MAFDRLDEAAGGVVELAQLQARELSHDYIGTEHLLLALTVGDFGAATRILANAGVRQASIRNEVIEELGCVDAPLTEADAEALATFGIDLDEIRRRVEESFGRSALDTSRPGSGGVTKTIPLTPRSKKVLRSSVSEAQRLGHACVTPEHLLLALLDDEKALAVKLIRRIGASPQAVRARAFQAISAP